MTLDPFEVVLVIAVVILSTLNIYYPKRKVRYFRNLYIRERDSRRDLLLKANKQLRDICGENRLLRKTIGKLNDEIKSYEEAIEIKNRVIEHSKQEKEIYELAELLMQSENLEASATILRDFAEKCYQEGAIDAQNDTAEEIREYYVEGGRQKVIWL